MTIVTAFRCRATLCSQVVIALLLVLCASARAETLRINGEDGSMRAMVDVAAGSFAVVRVGLEPSSAGISVALNGNSSIHCQTDASGICNFSHVSPGVYSVACADKQAAVVDVTIIKE